MSQNQHQPAIYALRRTLVEWNFDTRLAELIDFCRNARVEEVILKIDPEEFTHGIPPLEWAENYTALLKKAAPQIRDAGIRLSLNPWVTLVHCDRGRKPGQLIPELNFMVGHDGSQATACCCPLSKGWREHTRKLWQMYAQVNPLVMWVEDDIRTFNHRPVEFGCFCDLHLEKFAQKVGRKLSRAELVQAILKPGSPDPLRKIWLDLQRDIMIDTVGFLGKAVHEVGPDTYLGLMSSGPGMHCLEGRDWDAFAKSLGNGKPIYSRPPLGSYSEYSANLARGLYYTAAQVKRTRYVLPPDTYEQGEVENVPFTGYSKSAAFTFLQIAITLSHGSHGVTMNLFDHVGSPMSISPELGKMLSENYAFMQQLVNTHTERRSLRGVQILLNPESSYTRKLDENADYMDLRCPDFIWEHLLNSLGIVTTYYDSPVVAADGQSIAAYSDQQIKQMLQGGLLLDAVAAAALIERGFGDMLGFDIAHYGQMTEYAPISAEELTDQEFGGEPARYMTTLIKGLGESANFAVLKPAPGAKAVSRLVDYKRNVVSDFTTLFENSAGGRIAVVPYELRFADQHQFFLNHFRREHIAAIVNWLAKDKLPARVIGGPYPLTYRMDTDSHILLGLFNLTLDDWPFAEWHIEYPGKPPVNGQILDKTGKWQNIELHSKQLSQNRISIKIEKTVSIYEPLILRISS